jgi:hypothetical protein
MKILKEKFPKSYFLDLAPRRRRKYKIALDSVSMGTRTTTKSLNDKKTLQH